LRQLPWAHWSQVRGRQEPIGELQDVLAELSNVLAFALAIDGEGPPTPSRIVLNQWSQSKRKKTTHWLNHDPTYTQAGKNKLLQRESRGS
jgi:hypothetical protein